MVLITGLIAVLALACAASATAAGKPINVGTPFDAGQPAVAVDSAGDAVIAWANTKDLAPVTTNIVQYCILPIGATGCSHSGSLTPADSMPSTAIDNVQVLNEGSTLVILADVYGAAGSNAGDYTPEQEWQSTDGGATFTILNGGLSVADGIIDADTQSLSAVTVPGSGELGYGWDTAGASPPTFNAFPLASPPECSTIMCPTGYASLEPATNPDPLGNEGGEFAADANGVMGVFDTLFTNGPLGCAKSFGTAYVYGSGAQSPTNDYNISPSSPNSAWKVALAQADCDVENPAVAGGASGFGILEDNLGVGSVIYHRFDATTQRFDTKAVTVQSGHGEQQGALSQDTAGGVYATYLFGGEGGPATLSYSFDGGQTWASAPLDADKDAGISALDSSVNGAGKGWMTWLDNGSVFAQSFQAVDAVAAAEVSSGASSSGQTVSLSVTCASVPCSLSITLSAPETVVSHAASVPRKKSRAKTLTLGKGRFTLTKAGARKLSVNLSGAAKRLLRNKHGHFKITAAISEIVQHKTIKLTKTLTLTIKPSKAKHK